jgi:hypothetical protein
MSKIFLFTLGICISIFLAGCSTSFTHGQLQEDKKAIAYYSCEPTEGEEAEIAFKRANHIFETKYYSRLIHLSDSLNAATKATPQDKSQMYRLAGEFAAVLEEAKAATAAAGCRLYSVQKIDPASIKTVKSL